MVANSKTFLTKMIVMSDVMTTSRHQSFYLCLLFSSILHRFNVFLTALAAVAAFLQHTQRRTHECCWRREGGGAMRFLVKLCMDLITYGLGGINKHQLFYFIQFGEGCSPSRFAPLSCMPFIQFKVGVTGIKAGRSSAWRESALLQTANTPKICGNIDLIFVDGNFICTFAIAATSETKAVSGWNMANAGEG